MSTFTLKTITMTLDPSSIQAAIDEVRDLELNLKYALDALCEWLLKNGITIAKMNLRRYLSKSNSGERSGLLTRSIRYEMENGTSGTGYLIAGYPGDHMSDNGQWANYSYAVFFEFGFGTGSYYRKNGELIRSERYLSEYKSKGDVAHATGRTERHPTNPDVYRKMMDSKVLNLNGEEFFGWVYKDGKTGKFYVSKGQNPKPFMYETMLYLEKQAQEEGGRKLQQFITEYTP